MLNSKKLYLYKLITIFLPESRLFGLKNRLLRWCGAKIGKNVRIYSSAHIFGTGELEIGDDVFIGPRAILSSSGEATLQIGSHVNIGALCYVVTGTHLVDAGGDRTCGEGFNRDVVIGDGAWLVPRVSVLPEVMEDRLTIGRKALILGGSVVTTSIPECAIMQGNPATQVGVLRARPRRQHSGVKFRH